MTEPTSTIHGGNLRIDTHHHAVPRWYVEAAQRIGVHGGGGMPFPIWEPERSREFMDRLGIGAAVLSVSALGVYFGEHRGGLASPVRWRGGPTSTWPTWLSTTH